MLPFSDNLTENYYLPVPSLNDHLSVHPLRPAIALDNGNEGRDSARHPLPIALKMHAKNFWMKGFSQTRSQNIKTT